MLIYKYKRGITKSAEKTLKQRKGTNNMEKMTQKKAMEITIKAIEGKEIVSDEIIDKLKDVLTALDKKSKSVSKKKTEENAELLEKVLTLFSDAPNTLTEILVAHRAEFDELEILTSQKLNSVIKPAVEDGRLFREKNGKTTTFRLV